jgi:mannose-6-phosphate isomerase-like protein (cupin superfamily)
MFYVLEGELTFRCDNRTFDIEAGGFVADLESSPEPVRG